MWIYLYCMYIYIYTQQYFSLLYLIVKYLFCTASVLILTCPAWRGSNIDLTSQRKQISYNFIKYSWTFYHHASKPENTNLTCLSLLYSRGQPYRILSNVYIHFIMISTHLIHLLLRQTKRYYWFVLMGLSHVYSG